jgi:hypothetical protein
VAKIADIPFSSWLLIAITTVFLNVLLDEETSTKIPAIYVLY